ncbi:hypothetical protein [Allosphingosinicella sp.]|uniref:hypothetical protein n=1 Tax=Allosphingosinicella sp. TaxID=2823234 RepID=UPI0037839F6F
MIGPKLAAFALLAFSATATGQTSPAQPTPAELRARAAARGWGETLRMDAQALHDDIAANHPGIFNGSDPGFRRLNDEQLRIALGRAATARTYAAHFYALREYVAAFNDGHLDLGAFGASPGDDSHWPGFLTAYGADGEQRVAVRADDGPLPLGARLVGCDGRSAEQVLAENVGRFAGRWMLRSQRMDWGRALFADDGNPYARRPQRCTFAVDGQPREIVLNWQSIPHRELVQKFRSLAPQVRREFGDRTLLDGTRWVTLGSFNADPQSQGGRALPPLIAALRSDRDALARARAIVLDLRANDGGSSDWSRQIAEILWGRPAMNRLHGPPVRVDWRVSEANLASMREGRDRQSAGGHLSPEARHWFDVVITGLGQALARGEHGLWRHPADSVPVRTAPATADPPGLAGPVYILTDAGCASACLDAVDLWRALGAVHVGVTTSADTFYMDVRNVALPSGIVGASIPRKVFRGRPRGDNVPVVPVHPFMGDIADTAALERWIAGLPESRRRR